MNYHFLTREENSNPCSVPTDESDQDKFSVTSIFGDVTSFLSVYFTFTNPNGFRTYKVSFPTRTRSSLRLKNFIWRTTVTETNGLWKSENLDKLETSPTSYLPILVSTPETYRHSTWGYFGTWGTETSWRTNRQEVDTTVCNNGRPNLWQVRWSVVLWLVLDYGRGRSYDGVQGEWKQLKSHIGKCHYSVFTLWKTKSRHSGRSLNNFDSH